MTTERKNELYEKMFSWIYEHLERSEDLYLTFHDQIGMTREELNDHSIESLDKFFKKKDAELLNDCYYNSIELAYQNGCKSIAFPGISTGVYGYPLDEAARVSLLAAVHWLDAHKDTVMNIYFCCFKDAELSAYRKLTQ